MKVLITGASGFVGSNLLPYLQDRQVTVQRVCRTPETPDDVSWTDIRNLKPVPGVDVYIHLAGKAHDTKNTSDPGAYFEINTGLTKTFFDHFLQSEARDFIYFSSVKAVADQVDGILTETPDTLPRTVYGQSKREAELYLLNATLPRNKRVIIFRPCMIHGPGNKGNLNLLYSVVRRGIPYPLAAFKNQRSFLSVENLNYVVYQLLRHPGIPSGVYNLADDEVLSSNELVALIADTLECKARLLRVPKGALQFLARTGDRLHLPLNSERLQKLTESYVVSNTKIKSALRIEHMPVSARDGLSLTIQSFFRHN